MPTTTDPLGATTATLDMRELPEGDYVVTISVNPQATSPLILANAQPLGAKEGNQEAVVIPEEVTLQKVYLPLIEQ